VHVKIAQKLQHLNLQCNVTKNNGTKSLHKLCMKISQQKTWVSVELLPLQLCYFKTLIKLECGPMPNLMVALPNIGGALCSTPQSLADAHY